MDAEKELVALGFAYAGAIRPTDSGKSCSSEIKREIGGFVVYALVVENQIKKFGKTSTGIKKRIRGHASALDGVMRRGKATGDPFKRLAPEAIRANQEINVWARASTPSTYVSEELELNLKYQPAWVDNSRATTIISLRLAPDEQRLIEEAAKKKGWKAATFIRASALERAAQVVNLSRPTSFDFAGAAKRFAEVLVAPRTVGVADENAVHEGVVYDQGMSFGRFGAGPIAVTVSKDVTLDQGWLHDFKPAPLAPEQVEQLHMALRLGGAEFAAELIAECRRIGNVASDPNLPPPIDPQSLKG